jgi:hypothetical protein
LEIESLVRLFPLDVRRSRVENKFPPRGRAFARPPRWTPSNLNYWEIREETGSWHSTTELLPRACVFRYLTVRKGFSRFRGLSIPSRKSIPTMGSERKMDSKLEPKLTLARPPRPAFICSLPPHDIINIS